MTTHDSASAGAAPPPKPAPRDFKRLRESGEKSGLSRGIGGGFVAARDALARGLVGLGVTPNQLTLFGFLVTACAGYCLARGAGQQVPYFHRGIGPVGWWPAGAAFFLILAGACDMLDGAVARLGKLASPFGGILDSTLDRFSDFAVFVGCAAYFGWHGNLTYQLLAVIALCNANLISYVKARAETVIDDCSVGYWLRGERFAAMLIACLSGHLPAVLWQQAALPLLTVLRRVLYSYEVINAQARGRPAPPRGPAPGWRGVLQLWRHPRGSVPYDFVTGVNIAYIIFAAQIWPVLLATGPWADPLSRWLGR